MTGSLCNATNTTVFTDSGDYAKNTLIILNHLITNLLEYWNLSGLIEIMVINNQIYLGKQQKRINHQSNRFIVIPNYYI